MGGASTTPKPWAPFFPSLMSNRRRCSRPRCPTDNKARLRAETEEAQRLGLFGAPSFTTADGELFWGNDRLEHALAWAKQNG